MGGLRRVSPGRPRRAPRAALLASALAAAACGGGGGPGGADPADVVQVGGRVYTAEFPLVGPPLGDVDLGPVVAVTTAQAAENAAEPAVPLGDGGAGLLPVGTELRAVAGFDPAFRLAARVGGRATGGPGDEVALYEADSDPGARFGRDLLVGLRPEDVEAVLVTDAVTGRTELGAIRDPPAVRGLVAAVLDAPVDQEGRIDAPDCFVAFVLAGVPAVVRAYDRDAGLLARGVAVPEAFGAAVEAAAPCRGPS